MSLLTSTLLTIRMSVLTTTVEHPINITRNTSRLYWKVFSKT